MRIFTKIYSRLLGVLLAMLGVTSCEPDKRDELPLAYGTPVASFSISGKVVNSAGEPVEGIKVGVDALLHSSQTTTKADGSFDYTSVVGSPNDEVRITFTDIDGAQNGEYKETVHAVVMKGKYQDGNGAWDYGTATIDVQDITLKVNE